MHIFQVSIVRYKGNVCIWYKYMQDCTHELIAVNPFPWRYLITND